MKQKPVKALMALVLFLALAMGKADAVPASQTGQLTGENDVTEMVINVIVPANLNFSFDPLELNAEGGSQVLPHNFFFINKTGAPVNVSLNLNAVLSDGTELVGDPAALAKDDASVTDKRLFFAMLGADTLTAGDLSFSNTAQHNADGVYDPLEDTLVPFDPVSKKAGISFALAAASESFPDGGYDTLAAGDKGVGAFQFYAEVNTYAPWAKGDVSVTGYYSLTPLREPTYARYFAENGFTEGGWGTQLKQTGPDGSFITVNNPIKARKDGLPVSEPPFVPGTSQPASETPRTLSTEQPATEQPVSTVPPGLGDGVGGSLPKN
jgi:hypothetical protein